jgi:hypothetical protein
MALEKVLFVAWQQPGTKTYYTVGRLIQGPSCGALCFEFAYVHGAKEACKVGFMPFLNFPELEQVYWSEELFPFFANRVISSGRPDFAAYVARLGLEPSSADPMTILARSGGVRATDSLELFPLPGRDVMIGCYQTHFLVHDLPATAQGRIAILRKNELLKPFLDLAGKISLVSEDDVLVGYLPTYLLGDALRLANACSYLEVRVEQLNLSPAPLQQRLLCLLRSCWPPGFVPFDAQTFVPIAAGASVLSSATGRTTTTTQAPTTFRDLYATIIGSGDANVVRLPYRDGVWTGDGITVSRDRVLIDGTSFEVKSQRPFYADLVHNGRQIVITE